MLDKKFECNICGENFEGYATVGICQASDGLYPLCEKCKNIHEYEIERKKQKEGS